MSYNRYNDDRARAVFDTMAPLGPRLRVLDLGANDGWLSVRLAEAGHDVVAVERRDIERVTPRPDAPGRIDWVKRSFQHSDLPELGEFDVVIALSVIQHFKRPAQAWDNLMVMALQLIIAEIADPEEGKDVEQTARYRDLYDTVLATDGAEVLLWRPAWKRGMWRPTVAVRTNGQQRSELGHETLRPISGSEGSCR